MSNDQQEVEIWQCDNCYAIKHYEEEVWCWKCGRGEMFYMGKRWVPVVPEEYKSDTRSKLRRCLEFIPRLFMSRD